MMAYSTLLWPPVLEKEKSEFKPVVRLKIDLMSHPVLAEGFGKYTYLLEIDLVSHPACAEGLGKYIYFLKIDLVSYPACAEGLGKYIYIS